METELQLSLGGLPPLSARGCIQELHPIQTGQFRRTINGQLIFLGQKETKYKSIISCKDKNVLATYSLYPGQVMKVACIQRIWQKVEGQREAHLEKDAVEGSITILKGQETQDGVVQEGRRISFTQDADYICYRPYLNMMIKNYQLECDEWGMNNGWRLELEEV